MGYMEGILTLSIFVIIAVFFAKYMELNVSLLDQRFSTRGDSAYQGTFGHVWSHFWSPKLGEGHHWQLVS